MHAHACELLLPYLDEAEQQKGSVLDVGSGSGYRKSAAVLGGVKGLRGCCEVAVLTVLLLGPCDDRFVLVHHRLRQLFLLDTTLRPLG